MATIIKKASRQKVKIKLGFAGPAGSGKTMSALYTAYGLCGDWNKILLIDTENGSGELYSNLGDYNVISLQPPFTPESYIEAILTAENAGMEVIIIDSVSHEWEGKGGILETHSNMTGNSFTNWGKVTPRHNKFVESILQSKCHVICTLRTKTDYVLVEKNGKQVPEKVGLKAITREGWEYDLTVVFDLDMKQQATTSKDRTNMFMNKPQFIPSPDTGKLIRQWCETGVDIKPIDKPFSQQPKKWLYTEDLKHELEILLESATLDDNGRFAAENSIANVKSEKEYQAIKVRLIELNKIPV